MKIDIKTVINYVMIFTIFSEGLAVLGFFSFADFRVIYFLLPLILVLCIPLIKNAYFDKAFLWFYLFLAVTIIFSVINIFLGNNTSLLLSKQIVGIFLTSFAFFLLFKINNYEVKKLFKIYLNIAFLVALIGLVQVISFLLNFEMGYDFSYLLPHWRLALSGTGFLRVNSIFPEPAAFCYVIMPAFFASIVALTNRRYALLKKWKSLVVVSAFLLTFSTVGYIGIFLALALLIYNYGKIRYLFLLGLILIALIFFSWNYFEGFQRRIGDSLEIAAGKKDLEAADSSTFALLSNALVTHRVFLDSPLIGEGLGSRPMSYDKNIENVVDVERVYALKNREGGNSLFLRILSEMGLFGITAFFCFLLIFYLPRRKNKMDYLWVISSAVLVAFLIILIRSEHYFVGGVFFFFWLYYFTWKSNNKLKLNHSILKAERQLK